MQPNYQIGLLLNAGLSGWSRDLRSVLAMTAQLFQIRPRRMRSIIPIDAEWKSALQLCLAPQDYEFLRLILPEDSNLPETHCEWRECCSRELAAYSSGGRTLRSVSTGLDEYLQWMDDVGLQPDVTTLHDFAIQKDRRERV